MSRALTMAEPEGYVRIFVDEGEPMSRLLRAAEAAEVAPTYVRRLLTAADASETRRPATRTWSSR